MGFFKDFKRDFAQAVNELMPDKDELGAEYEDDDMVDTFDDADLMDVAPEDQFENLDEIRIDSMEPELSQPEPEEEEEPQTASGKQPDDSMSVFDTVPMAAEIRDDSLPEADSFSEDELSAQPETEILTAEPVSAETIDTAETADELEALDALDEENMLEETEDALRVETREEPAAPPEALTADLEKAVEDTLARQAAEFSAEEDRAGEEPIMEQTAETEDKKQPDTVTDADTTYITKTTVINGDIETDGGIDLIGTVNGAVSCDGKLIIGGRIKGDVKVGELYANAARIEGDIHVADAAKIGVGTVVVGNLFSGSAVIAGAVKGDIDVQGPVIVDSTAVIMGNIKSKSVQINNGAVIEGMCSQCYSEINVSSFFE